MGTRAASAARAIGGIAVLSVVAGVLAAFLITPGVAIAGNTTTSVVGVFDELPDDIALVTGAQANQLVYKGDDGGYVHLASVFTQNREQVALDDMSVHLQDAAVAGEDERFWEHGGVDLTSVVRAGVGVVTKTARGGGSTLTMQLVRNILIQQIVNSRNPEHLDAAAFAQWQADERAKVEDPTLDRKLREMKLALALEDEYTKAQVLQGYLNIAGFGGNTYGVEAAARQYYGVDASDVSVAQAASLLAIVQDPTNRGLNDPDNWASNKNRRDVILDKMHELGYIDTTAWNEALNTPIDATTVQNNLPRSGCAAVPADFAFACDYLVTSIDDLEVLGATPEQRQAAWADGGYTIVASIDPTLQAQATSTIQKWVPKDETRFELGGAVTSVEVGTGRILAMAQNKDYTPIAVEGDTTKTALNFSADSAHGGSKGFQPGSTWKPYVLLAFLKAGHGVNETFNASVRSIPPSKFVVGDCGQPNGGVATPFTNDGNEGGRWTVRNATAKSINSVFFQMATEIDQCAINSMAESMGVHNASDASKPLDTLPSCVVGGCGNNVAPVTAAAAFAAIADSGLYCAPHMIDDVIAPDGTSLGGQATACQQSEASPEVAQTAANVMQGAFQGGGTAAQANPYDGTPHMGKTGTTNDAIHLWLVGSSTRVSTAVWVGNIEGEQSLRAIRVSGMQASQLRNPIYKEYAKVVDARYPGEKFADAAPGLVLGTPAYVPRIDGGTIDRAKSAIETAELAFTDGGAVESDLPVGEVVRTEPAGGSRVARGSTVTVFTSGGPPPAAPAPDLAPAPAPGPTGGPTSGPLPGVGLPGPG